MTNEEINKFSDIAEEYIELMETCTMGQLTGVPNTGEIGYMLGDINKKFLLELQRYTREGWFKNLIKVLVFR